MLRRKFLRLMGVGSAAVAVGAQLPLEQLNIPVGSIPDVTPPPLNTLAELGDMLSGNNQVLTPGAMTQIVDAIRGQSYQMLIDSNYHQAIASSKAPRFLRG